MRNLLKDDNNTVTLYDPVDGAQIVLRHRGVTSRDRVRHLTRKYERQGSKLINRYHSACVESAADVLTGIRDGDFAYGSDPISSDPASEHYRADWKRLVVDMAGDILFILGVDLFEPKADLSALASIDIESEFESERGESSETDPAPPTADSEETIAPLAKSCAASKSSVRRSAGKSASKSTA